MGHPSPPTRDSSLFLGELCYKLILSNSRELSSLESSVQVREESVGRLDYPSAMLYLNTFSLATANHTTWSMDMAV